MIVSSFTKRSFYRQTGTFSFQVDLTFEDYSGCEIGFSGQTNLPFFFKNGRITDSSGYFFSSYQINESVSLSGNVSSTDIDYFINGEPKALGLPRSTGYLDYFYAKPESKTFDLDIFINGEKPIYSHTESINYHTGDNSIPVNLTNTSSIPFRIFSGSLLSDSDLFTLSGFPVGIISGTKTFYFTPNNLGGANSLDIKMETDFGPEVFTIDASGIVNIPDSTVIELTGPPIIDSLTSGVYYCTFSNGSGSISVMPILKYVSGSGTFSKNLILTGSYSTTATGFLNGSGNLNNTVTISGSGFGGINNDYVESPFDYIVQSFSYATGNFSWNFSVLGSGIGSASSYIGDATGIITGTVFGTILDGSGFYRYSGLVYQPPTTAYSSSVTGRAYATGLIIFNSPAAFDFLYVGNPDIALAYGVSYTGQLDLINYLNTNTGLHKVTATAFGSNIIITSIVAGPSGNFLPLYVDSDNHGTMSTSSNTLLGGADLGLGVSLSPIGNFQSLLTQDFLGTGYFSKSVSGEGTGLYVGLPDIKSFTGTWDMLTGLTIDNLVSSKNGGYISSNIISGTPYTASVGSFYIYLPYINNFPIADLISLSVTGIGLGTGKEILISGNI